MGKEDYIAVSHFINPQLFWYHKIDVQTPAFKELQRIEEAVQLLYTAKQSAALLPYRPTVGEVVAIAFLSWNKFIRARVEYIAKYTKAEDEYIVWALDYGFPFRTKLSYVRKMPESYAKQTDHIRLGGIANLIPVDTEFDFVTTTNKTVCKKSWSKRPVEMLEKIINDAASISFVEMFVSDGGPAGTQYFGDLKIVNHMGVEFMVSEYLLKLNSAMKCPHGFKEKLLNLNTIDIPCWQTNNGDMKIIENKLNSLNVNYGHHGNFNLSGNLSDFSCDNFSKQKVMDWCERNQNLDKIERYANSISALNDLDASEISFDDSVSVNNYKQQGLHMTYEDTFMGCAGALHEGRKKKYQGKGLPPKPSLEVFEVISEKAKHSEDKKNEKDEHSSESMSSAPSQRAKSLLELRKKLQKEASKTKSDENIPNQEMRSKKLDTPSEAGTEEFLQICKEKNAHSARLAKLKELRTRRIMDANCNRDQREEESICNEEMSQENDDKSGSCAVSTKSSRLLLLQKIKKKHSKQGLPEKENNEILPNSMEDEPHVRSEAESTVSTHAARLISIRKKIKEKYSQQSELVSDTRVENKPSEVVFPDSAKEKSHNVQQQHLKMHERTKSGHEQSPKLNETVFPGRVKEEKSVKNQKSTDHTISDHIAALELSPKGDTDSGLRANNDASSQVSSAREAELRNIRQMIRSNPFQVMTMVPGGFDVTKLDKRNNEEQHWHTKKTTLNDSSHSNKYSSAEFESHNNSKEDSNQSRSVARRTENVEEQNFRLTRTRKERKKSETSMSVEEKHILDASLTDNLLTAPVILPKTVTTKNSREVPVDLLLFIENETNKSNENAKQIISSCKEEKLIDLSDANESLNDSSSKYDRGNHSAKDSSREKLLETGHGTSDDSFDLMILESPKNTSKASGVEGSSLKELHSSKESKNKRNGEKLNPSKLNEDCSYEASLSSTSSHTVGKAIIAKLPTTGIQRAAPTSSSNSSMQHLLKNSLLDEDCNKLIRVEPNEKSQSSSSSSSSFVKINPNEPFANVAEARAESVSLPPVTSKWRKTPSSHTSKSDSISCRLNSSSSTTFSNKVSASSGQSSVQRSSSESGKNMATNESNARLPQVAGEASLKTNLIEHLVLAHSHAKVSPIEKMTSALFSPGVHREMENMRLTKMYRIQSYAWAHLIRGNSFFVVNPARTGKSWCYLPPICSMVNYRMESEKLPQSYGPVAVIIAPSSIQVENISRQCRRLLASSTKNVTIVSSYAFRNSEEVKIELLNGCGILIITPPSLRRLLIANEKESLLSMERIQFVVLDDVDMMINHYSEFNETLNKFFGPVLRQESGKVHFQLVVTSKRWSRHIINLLKISSQPMLCIGDFLEAAVYAKSKISIKLQSKSEKMTVMMEFLQSCSYSLERIVIVCNSIDEVDDVEKSLIDGGLVCLPFTERTPLEYQNLIHEWKIKTICHEILVTMDSILPELMIQNATVLIHYSLPKSWTKFNFRFSVFLQKHHNMIKNAFSKPANFAKSVILLDEENNVQLPRLIEFMKHHDQLKHVHPDIINVASKVTEEREEARVKQGILMCPRVLEFGSCDESNRCIYRHLLTKYDVASDGIPTEGEVRIKILDVLSPTHYIARLLTHKTEGTWEIIRRSNEVTRFFMQMLLHFTNDDSHVVYWPLRVKEMCVYKSEDTFHRCRILEVPPIVHESIVKVVNVKVKLIDSGQVIMCKSNNLLVIPEKFVDFPAQAIDIRLSGVKPFDNERSWDTRSTRTVKNWIMTEVTEVDCLQAYINFALMDTIWVRDVVLMEKLATIRGYALKVNVRRSLIGKEFAIADDADHLVKKIAIEHGLLQSESRALSTPESALAESTENPCIEENLMEFSTSISDEKDVSNESVQKSTNESMTQEAPTSAEVKCSTEEASDKPTEVWMQLELDELNQIKIGEFHDPEQFYVRLTRQSNELTELESLIKQLKKDPLEAPYPMQNCLAPRDGVYHRAKIQRLEVDSSDGRVQARVFFCDLGVFSNFELNELCSSNKELTEFMPFQAISCKLTGIQIETVGNEIQNLIPKNNCVYMAYIVEEISKEFNPDEDFHLHNYEIILYECLPEKYDVQINKLLVEKGLAEFDPKTKHFLEIDSKASFKKIDDDSDVEPSTFDFQGFLAHMQAILDEEDAEKRREEEERVAAKVTDCHEENENKFVEVAEDKTTKQESIVPCSPKDDSQVPTLKTLYKCPLTTWYETMCMIYLVIHAPDITEYFLEVSPKRLMFSASVADELQVLVLDFLGYVEPEQVTHEIRGLNVVVRLVKSVYMKWPRLLETSTKYPWLTYNLDAIDSFQAENMIEMSTSRARNRLTSTSSETSDTSSSNPCETFTPIVNYDQLHDPIEELF